MTDTLYSNVGTHKRVSRLGEPSCFAIKSWVKKKKKESVAMVIYRGGSIPQRQKILFKVPAGSSWARAE